jgi:hypothetical protein
LGEWGGGGGGGEGLATGCDYAEQFHSRCQRRAVGSAGGRQSGGNRVQ